ncbi:MAG TPA: protein kinase [Kofleriaceae bacterium]|nr:protein kinase [Kofleriaceae bacterium]
MEPVLVAIAEEGAPLHVGPRQDLAARADAAVMIGEAPDGLPLVLEVERARRVGDAVRAVLGGAPDKQVAEALEALEGAIAAAARRAGLFDLGGTPVYRTGAPVGALFGETMLARILGGHSPLLMDTQPTVGAAASSSLPLARRDLGRSPVTRMRIGVAAQRHVAVPLANGPVLLVEDGEAIEPETIEPLRLEDLRPLPTARFVGRGGLDSDGPLADGDAYRAALAGSAQVGWGVGAADVAHLIAEIARSLTPLHEEGRVHGDLKPANALVTGQGAVAIDPLGVAIGDVAPGITPGWAAPEQLLARALVPSTDVYPLGLMLARLFGAVVCGEERSFVVPAGPGQGRRVRLLADHDVYLDPDRAADLPMPLAAAWQDFIRQCLEFDPDDRPASATHFADRIDELLDAAPLAYEMPCPAGPGVLRRDVHVAGDPAPGWVVRDTR